MKHSVQQEPAYVLHRRPYRETSLLVDVFGLNSGRMTLMARGASAPRSPLKAQLQPFQALLLDWQGRGDLKNLTQTEVRPGAPPKGTQALYSGLYLNELLQRLLPIADPHPELFAYYVQALHELSGERPVEPVLRRFEMALAATLGFGFDWDRASDTGAPVSAGQLYGYDPERGIVTGQTGTVRVSGLAGETLLALAGDQLADVNARRAAKQVMRALIDHLLQGRPLNSRALFSQRRGEGNAT